MSQGQVQQGGGGVIDCARALVRAKLIVGVSACGADESKALGGCCVSVREGHGRGVSAASSSACFVLVYNTTHTSNITHHTSCLKPHRYHSTPLIATRMRHLLRRSSQQCTIIVDAHGGHFSRWSRPAPHASLDTPPARSHCVCEGLMNKRESFPQALPACPRDAFEGATRR